MATQANVTLRFLMSGANSVVGIMDRISGKKRDLERPVEIPIDANDRGAQDKFDKVKAELTELNHSTAEPKIRPNDVVGMAKMAAFKYELRKLNDYVARPTISERGLARTEMRILKLKASLNSISDSGPGLLSRAFTGVSGVGSGASALAIQGITSPVGAAATAAAIPFAGTALGGGILGAAGAGLAGLGVAGGMGLGSSRPRDVMAAQETLRGAQLRVIATQAKLNKLQSSGKATTAQLASAQGALARAHASVVTAQEKILDLGPATSRPAIAAQEALRHLLDDAKSSLLTIGASFAPVMKTILDTARGTLDKMTPVFASAERKIAGPFQRMGVVLVQSFTSPQMIQSIQMVAKAFADFLVVFTPQIPGIVNSLAGGITGIATAFEDHPGMIQGMANVVDFLFKLPGYIFSAIGALVRVTSWMTSGFPHMVSIGLDAARIFFIGFGHDVEAIWNSIWGAITGVVSAVIGWLTGHWKLITGILLGPIIIVPAMIIKYWDQIKAPFVAGYNFIIGVYKSIMDWVTSNFDKWWANNGEAIKIIWRNVWSETVVIFHQFFDPIVNVVKASMAIIRSVFEVNFAAMRGIATIGWGVIRGLFVGGMQAITLVWRVGWTAIGGVAKIMWINIQAFTRIGWSVINFIFKSSIGVLVASWRIFWSVILNVAKVIWTVTKNAIKGIWDIIVGIFSIFINLITGRWHNANVAMKNMGTQIWNLTKDNLRAIWNAIKNIGIAIWNALRAYLVGLWNNMKSAAISIWNTGKTAVLNIWRTLVATGKTIWNNFFSWLRTGWRNVVSSASTIWQGVKAAVMNPVRWVAHNVLAPLFRGIDSVTSFVLHKAPLAGAAKALAGMAEGGKINVGSGETADDVLIRVSRNETVLSAAHSRMLAPLLGHIGVPGYGNRPLSGDDGYNQFPGFASGGAVEKQMLGYMLSKRGQAYSQANRWGEPPWDCSSLVWQAAHNAGVPIPKSAAIANSEANWFGSYPGTYHYGGRSQVQTGDIIASTGASPGPSRFGGVGHIGMAANSSTLISALGSRYGVTLSRIPSNMVQGFRLGGPGGKGILSSIGGFFGSVFRSLGDIFSPLGKYAKAAISLASGNIGPAISAMLGWIPHGSGGAQGGFGEMLSALPGRIISDFVHFIVNAVKNFAQGEQYGGGDFAAPTGPLQDYAKKLLANFGWSNQWGAFSDIVRRESNWNVHATNPSSGAYGIPQALPGSKMASAGPDWRTSGYTQLRWMMSYIKTRWGSPANADAHERAAHWYATGTRNAQPGWAWVGERGPELVNFRGGEQVIPHGRGRGGGGTHIENVNVYFRGQPLHTKGEIGRTVKEAIAYAESHGN